MINPTAHVPAPAFELRDGLPVSTAFDDVYFSRGGGIAETEHVFLTGNGLPERWQAMTTEIDNDHCVGHAEPLAAGVSDSLGGKAPYGHKNDFTIAELGFGTGLNFLVTVKAFRATAHRLARLHYIAIEKFPFTPAQLHELLSNQPELSAEAQELIAAYPLRLPGIHRVHLGNVSLTLCFGDVVEMLGQLTWLDSGVRSVREPRSGAGQRSEGGKTPFNQPYINAWHLDGFSPAKNGAMWAPEIYQQMRALSAPNATFATFTSASHVRRGLEAVGFTAIKTKGFGHKREMSVGVLESSVAAHGVAEGEPSLLAGGLGVIPPSGKILIIGAGIAGATLARALAERGYGVTVIERSTIASGASGNAAGVLFPQITKQWGGPSDWYFTAYSYALRQLHDWQSKGLAFEHSQCGMLRLPRHAEEEMLLQHLQQTHGLDASIVHWLERDAARAQAGVALQTGAAFFPEGTWLNPAQLCAALLQHKNITLREQTGVESLARVGGQWQLTLADGETIQAENCCITAAYESSTLLAKHGIKLGAVGGQVSMVVPAQTTPPLRSILCHSGYVIPLAKQRVAEGEPCAAGGSEARVTRPPSINSYLVGATYHREEMLAVTASRHNENRAALAAIVPDWAGADAVAGRSSIRATTPDRLPYVGAIDTGLYVSTGHGSRGLLSAPLAAEMIASSIAGETPPVRVALQHITRPLRFRKA